MEPVMSPLRRGASETDPHGGNRTARPRRVRSAGLRCASWSATGRGDRNRQPFQQGPPREPAGICRQGCRVAPARRQCVARGHRHDSPIQSLCRPVGVDWPNRPDARAEPPALYAVTVRGANRVRRRPLLNTWSTRWRSANRCQHCRSGWTFTWACSSTWKPATRKRATCCASHKLRANRVARTQLRPEKFLAF